MEGILDFSKELDVELLDRVVETFFKGSGQDQKRAQEILTQFQENLEAWTRVDTILEKSRMAHTKFIGLQILEKIIQTRWKILPGEQQTGIKNFIVSIIIKISSSEGQIKENKMYLSKLNLILVEILKQEWPQNWPTFIPELVASSKTSISLCYNNMEILRLLSEEIFDFSEEQMTSKKAQDMKTQLRGEFSSIFELCNEVIQTAMQASLVKATLETLLRFLSWIPVGYIFETELIETMCTRFLEARETRNVTIKCLAEIAGLQVNMGSNEAGKIVKLYEGAMEGIGKVLGEKTQFGEEWETLEDDEQEFIQNVVQFLATVLGRHLTLLESRANMAGVIQGHRYLVGMMGIQDRELFKVCLEYSNGFVKGLYEERRLALGSLLNLKRNRSLHYEGILTEMRQVVIDNMAKPSEVLVVENDDGEIVREFIKETDTINVYKAQRECLVLLTHLDSEDMERIMMEKLAKQLDSTEWSWNNLNKLCWAFGSISGAMGEEQERRFLVVVIKGLLGLCEMVRGKDNKAVVAANIMYVVGQYPRFLKAHWKFLKTVVNKLFEFMHELHPGVQDMAIDTFIKLADKCRKHFLFLQQNEQMPFIDEIIATTESIISDLEPAQIVTFYNAVGRIVAAESDPATLNRLLTSMMALPNKSWGLVGSSLARDAEALGKQDLVKSIDQFLRINISVCQPLGYAFLPQLANIYIDLMSIYAALSTKVAQAVAQNGPVAVKYPVVRAYRSVKKNALVLAREFINSSKDHDLSPIISHIVPPLFETVIPDYAAADVVYRDYEVLSLITTVIDVLGHLVNDRVPDIVQHLLFPTLASINRDFTEYPDLRLHFYSLLTALSTKCFTALLLLDPDSFKMLVHAIVWGFKHTQRDISEQSLSLLYDLVNLFVNSEPHISSSFFSSYYFDLLSDIFYVLTDSDHKSGFHSQCLILSRLFNLSLSQSQSQSQPQSQSHLPSELNQQAVSQYLANLLLSAFPNLSQSQVSVFVSELFAFSSDFNKFKLVVHDFLIQLKVFNGEVEEHQVLFKLENDLEIEKLKLEQRNADLLIPGLVKPSEMDEGD